MKNLMKIFVMLTVSLFATAAFFACSDQNEEVAPVEVDTRALISIPADKVITKNTTWKSSNRYLLWGKVYVTNGATLTIQEGTKIYGKAGITNPRYASALIVTKGAKLVANGTASRPIVFSSFNGKPGGWGGIVLLGKAPINQSAATIEGIDKTTVPSGVDVTFGGNKSGDSSGSLKYVRVEYAGAAIADDNELNAFTFGGVGSGTVLEHLQAYKGQDDAFEFFGGTVNAKYLVSTATHDDAFDFDFGYCGKIQFAVATIDASLKYSKDSNGIECDNDSKGTHKTPYTHPVLSNLTLVGTTNGKVAATSNGSKFLKSAANFRRNCRFTLVNSVLYGFPKGVLKETSNSFVLKNNVVASVPAGNEFASFTADASNKAVGVNALKLSAPFGNYYSSNALKPIAGPAKTGASFTGLDAWFTRTSYKGAIDKNGTSWLTEAWIK